MDSPLPSLYLAGLVVLLAILSVVIGIQVWKVRRDEATLQRLQQQLRDGKADPVKLYELGSVQLRKRLFPQAVATLNKAAQGAGQEPSEGQALIHNALGYALAAQKQYAQAVRHYRKALEAKPDYPVALNNLGHALERRQQRQEAAKAYAQTLALDAGNAIAKRRLQRLEKARASTLDQ
ncbi:MAG: tetratricopeptide repeat protein [Synechococcus sp. SB0662_bin_45]|uniref:Tetratricopeptide repeat protein n=1 Tax=Synechococcus sp. SB0676_bin_10 TaxID=2604869 RepID=A0A6B1F509_9SYNE|nr:tetratricopeptide repeat protein [Cyanobacteria bacterium MAG IRC3_bin_20]MCY3654485.1 tetratricopeptide repeat protein [Cyanobacteria bacterium MAG IRC1_bin_28]MDE0646752.1 tetratricopeptide repeat protein [Cyanobacteria bacterium MAG IRC4_bin_6]MXW12121.1 tetratricopeptide repeat protein [Synechococcus sp. SB0668_bin_13]MXX08588.1 tetratricopeptide repeat protein [Synechococcus sp. SB0667_bin_8]MYE21705.1 tetratricopeptide repeat protein [Synechococcus sp. SB0662_bin_45]MYG37839.1 tetrat